MESLKDISDAISLAEITMLTAITLYSMYKPKEAVISTQSVKGIAVSSETEEDDAYIRALMQREENRSKH
jgi:hypothetical protein